MSHDDLSDSDLVDLTTEDWIITDVIERCLENCFEMIRFRYFVDRYTRRAYIKFRVKKWKSWKSGWRKFLVYIETQEFEQGLIKYLVKKKFSERVIMKIFSEFREEFFNSVRGEEGNLQS